MMEASASPPLLRWVMTIQVNVAAPIELGTRHGIARRTIPIVGGRFSGPLLQGKVLPVGADWQQSRLDGVALLDARYTLQTDAGDLISVTNRGFRHGSPDLPARFAAGEHVPPAEYYFMTAPSFETAAPELQWLTRAIFVGAGERQQKRVILNVWQVGEDPTHEAIQASSGSPT